MRRTWSHRVELWARAPRPARGLRTPPETAEKGLAVRPERAELPSELGRIGLPSFADLRAVRAALASLFMCYCVGTPGGAVAQAQGGEPASTARRTRQVESVLTAMTDARDAAVVGDRVVVATDGGLIVLRNGGVERSVGTREGLPGARLRSVTPIGDEIWVGGVEGTARVYVGADGVRVLERLPVRRVRRAAALGGAVWLASYGDGLYRVDGEGARAIPLGAAHAYRRLTDLLVRGDELWVATAGVGILRVNAEGRVVGRVRRRHGLRSEYLWRMIPAGERLFVTHIDGVDELGPDGLVDRDGAIARSARRLPIRDVRAALSTTEGIYFATFGRGLFVAPRGGGSPRPVGTVQHVHALTPTPGGVLVSHAGGVHRVRGGRLRPVVTGGLPSADVTALARAFGTLFIGTFERGLARVREGRVEPIDTSRWSLDRRINDLAVSGRGSGERLWIATDRGLYWHDGRVFARVEDPAGPSWIHTTSLHVDRRGAVWVTTSRELCRYTGQWRCWTGDETFPVAQLHAVTTDARGQVWTGGLHGLYRFDPHTGRFFRHTVSSGDLPVDWVTAICPWENGVVAGTYHGGLAIGDGAGFRLEREGAGGLPSGWVNPHAIRRVGDELWIGTLEGGLMVGRPGSWQHLTTRDGLPSDDVTDVFATRDAIWVATRGGLARVAR